MNGESIAKISIIVARILEISFCYDNGVRSKVKYIIGIDEVGRGPLAGPVTLCACVLAKNAADKILATDFRGIDDSKKLSPKEREKFFKIARKKMGEGVISYAVAHVSARVIDRIGISKAIKKGIERVLERLRCTPSSCEVLLDGSLKAPEVYKKQKTIIGGDALLPIISLASVIAKVTRDKKMIRLSKKFPQYGLEIHKGYGTAFHYAQIRSHDLCELHRRSFMGEG